MMTTPKILPILGLNGITLRHGAHNRREQLNLALVAEGPNGNGKEPRS